MKITDIKIHALQSPLAQPFAFSQGWVNRRSATLVEVLTDEGISGWGEAFAQGLEPPQIAVAVIDSALKPLLLGANPLDTEVLWHRMYHATRDYGRKGSVIAGISAIDIALWDIAGKAAGLPVYMLLGGKCREKIRLYQSAGGNEPSEVAESAKRLVEKYGYTAIKMSPHMRDSNARPVNYVTRMAGQRVRAVREALGPDVDIGVDIHAKFFEVTRAIRMAREIEPYNPMWLEEPIRPENVDAMSKLADHVNIPLASGECNYTKHEFRSILHAQCLDFVQPDICLCGGIMEMKKIAAMADACYTRVAPHNPMGPLATVVNVHFAASTPNFFILEYHPDDVSPRKDLLQEPLMVKDGYITVPTKPGWGVELNEEAFKKYPPRPWRRGFDYRADGSVAYI
jgi:L-alanine-DL-glutamate epimerase-like enolase superfamily enzyme